MFSPHRFPAHLLDDGLGLLGQLAPIVAVLEPFFLGKGVHLNKVRIVLRREQSGGGAMHGAVGVGMLGKVRFFLLGIDGVVRVLNRAGRYMRRRHFWTMLCLDVGEWGVLMLAIEE